MSARPDPDAFANLLCEWCLDVRREQQVLFRSTVHGLPLVRALHPERLERRPGCTVPRRARSRPRPRPRPRPHAAVLGIGTNTGIDRATGSILLDEKIAGNVHLALGRSYPETGGTNQSALHWDLICDLRAGGRPAADGHVVNENGRFVE